MTIFFKQNIQAKTLGIALAFTSTAAIANQDLALDMLDLEQLMQIEITTASRKAQTLSRTPAAAHVITREDIRRAGVTSLPEALRLAPGVQVAQVSPSQWSVTIRGFGGRYAGKLLVLIDGRSIYTPVFAGVYWEIHSPLLDDIERIEVIRGPGATLWGANAVNGVINVITRHSQDSEGGSVHTIAGNQQQSLSARYGVKLNDHASYRVYANVERQTGFEGVLGEDLDNGFDRYRVGLRSDWYSNDNKDHFTVHSEGVQMQQGQTIKAPDMSAPDLSRITHRDNDISAVYALGRWQRSVAVDEEFSLQGYVEYHDRDAFAYDESRFTAAVDFQYRMALGQRHDFLWGASYRDSSDSISTPLGRMRIPRKTLNVFSLFAQNEFAIIPHRLWLTLGIKAEDSEYSDLEWQPNLRLLWTPASKHTLWGSVARAIRMPSRFERDVERFDFKAQFVELPSLPTAIPTVVSVAANPDFESEEVIAYEAGYRTQFNDAWSVDLALFYNDYRQLREFYRLSQLVPQAEGHFLIPVAMDNSIEGSTSGGEISFTWQPDNHWYGQLSYAWMNFDLDGDLPAAQSMRRTYEQGDPHRQLSLRGGWRLNNRWTTDAWLRWIDEVPHSGGAGSVDRYFSLDMRLAWTPRENLELALLGKNLLEARHQEAVDDFFAVPNEIPRSVALSLRWQF